MSDIGGVSHFQANGNQRVFFVELVNDRREEIVAHDCACSDCQFTGKKVVQVIKNVFDLSEDAEEFLRIAKKDFSFSRQSDLAFASIKKRVAQCVFNALNLLRNRGLSHVKGFGGLSETA